MYGLPLNGRVFVPVINTKYLCSSFTFSCKCVIYGSCLRVKPIQCLIISNWNQIRDRIFPGKSHGLFIKLMTDVWSLGVSCNFWSNKCKVILTCLLRKKLQSVHKYQIYMVLEWDAVKVYEKGTSGHFFLWHTFKCNSKQVYLVVKIELFACILWR